jgi:hypothetical protein
MQRVVHAIFQLAVLFGGPALGIVAIDHYPFLVSDRTLYVIGISCGLLFFLLTFPLFRRDDFLRKLPIVLRAAFRVGWGVASTFFLIGVVGIANGYGTPSDARRVAVVAKRETLQQDPARRAYYLAVRPWPGARTVVELEASKSTYDRLSVPLDVVDSPQKALSAMPDAGEVILIVGKGRLGLEWLKGIGPT